MTKPRLKTLLGDYPITAAFRRGQLTSPLVDFDFADVKVPNTAFKRTVRDLEFDVSEMAIVTHLIALAHGKPYVLLPAVVLGRFQHPYILVNTGNGRLGPGDLGGKRIGVRSYAVTTVTWLRGILEADHGLDLDSVKWVTFEDGHVAEFADPPTCERAAPGKDMTAMLLAGELDAAVITSAPEDPRIVTLFPDPQAAADAWHRKNNAIQINHMVAIRSELSREHPELVRELWRLLKAAKAAAGLPKPGSVDAQPFGVEANRRNLEVAIDYVYRQKLIPRRLAVDELFDDVMRALT